MHVRSLLKLSMFEIEIEGRPASRDDVFPVWRESDRFGVVIDEPFGAIGATHLMQLAMTGFYDVKPSRRSELAVYPEIYAFHIGKGHGSHAPYDIWPARREVIIESGDPRDLLDAINDRAITRLALPDIPEGDADYRPKEAETAIDRLVSCFVYHSGSRTPDADIVIRGVDPRTEYNPNQTLKLLAERGIAESASPGSALFKEADAAYIEWLRRREADVEPNVRAQVKARREALREGGTVAETYRRISVRQALRRLASTNQPLQPA
ncbi:hypothetical protein [Terrarubrum flagellatum]|uniref:hypothetical protein n=1 Tax=Terrirubrum flagellatum TaxID=2895980 RepID=UPI003144F712